MVERRIGDITTVPTRLGRLRVDASGTGDPAVLWHSLFVDSTSWSRVRTSLGSSRRLLMIDGPSHGGSAPLTRRFTLEECAGAALDVLDHLGIREPVDWVGNAWGGHVGMLFAAANPTRCRSLVTIGTPIRALRAGERRQIRALVAIYRLIGPADPLVRAVERGLLTPRTCANDPDAVRVVADHLRHADRRGMWTAMQSVMLARSDLTPALPGVAAPALIITGDELAALTPADARAAAARLPHGTAAVVPGARHLAPLEAAPAVADLVTDFWRVAAVPQDAPAGSEHHATASEALQRSPAA